MPAEPNPSPAPHGARRERTSAGDPPSAMLQVQVQHSTDGTTWVDVGSPQTVTLGIDGLGAFLPFDGDRGRSSAASEGTS